jgi:hypothetical protein
LRERAAQQFNRKDWVRGKVATPHPTVLVGHPVLPSPARGEGAITIAEFLEVEH